MDRVLLYHTATVNASGSYANTATISAAEADQHREQQCYGNTRTRSTNVWNHQNVNNAP
jgi:hypothetical protein